MTFPAFLIGLLCALLLGVLFHIWADGGAGRLVLYLCLSMAGFATGQYLGSLWNLNLIPVGALDLGLAIIGGLLFLGVGHWLSMVRVQRPGSNH